MDASGFVLHRHGQAIMPRVKQRRIQMVPQQKFCLELHLVGEVKVLDPIQSDEITVGQVSIDLGKVAQMTCSSDEFYMQEPRSPVRFARLDDALVVGMRRTATVARYMTEGLLNGEKLAEAVKSGKFRSFGLRGQVTPEVMQKLDNMGLRAIAPIVESKEVN
jgi:hypothetical protein